MDEALRQRLYRPVVFEPAEFLHEDSAWVEHVPFAGWLVEATGPRVLVELGTHAGISYCAFCQAIGYLGLETRAHAVDTWEGDAQSRSYGEEVLAALREHHDPRYERFSRLHRKRFADALGDFADGSIDLLHIDGLHTYEAVAEDYESWRPKMSDRGVMILHDIAERGGDFGVWRLWGEVRSSHPSFAFAHEHGLGVLGVGDDLPEPVRWLCEQGEADAEATREFFAARGALTREALELLRVRAELGRQLGKVDALTGQVAGLNAQVAELEQRAERLKTDLDLEKLRLKPWPALRRRIRGTADA